jgi:hypothetical protein
MNTLYADMAIDAIQNAKKSWVNTFVKDETFAKPLHAFVESQTAFTKQIAKSAMEMGDATGTAMFNAMQNAVKGGK